MLKQGKTLLLLSLCSILWATDARAGCTANKPVKEYTMPLNGTLNVPASLPVGGVIFQQVFAGTVWSEFNQGSCYPAVRSRFIYSFLNNGLSLSSHIATYKTNVEGIGVKFQYGDMRWPHHLYTIPGYLDSPVVTPASSFTVPITGGNDIIVSLIKIDNTIGSGVIDISSFPVIQFNMREAEIMRLSFSGAMSLNTPTCDISTPSTSVPLGTHEQGVFGSIGSGTAWKDASIRLTNCGTFSGWATNNTWNSGTGTSSPAAIKSNIASVTLTPNDGVVSATDGIIKIATTGANNTPHAVGVGIQLSTTESVVGKVNLNNPLEYTLPTDGRLSITLPLYARYIKTASTVTGGKANGKLTFTVTYN